VQLAAVDAELLDRPQDQLGHEAGPVGIEEPEEGPAHPVVVERTGIDAIEAEDRGAEGIGPLTERVDRLAVPDEVSHDDTEHDRRGDLQPAVVVGNVAFEQLVQVEALDEVVDQRHGTEQFGVQLELAGHCPPPSAPCLAILEAYILQHHRRWIISESKTIVDEGRGSPSGPARRDGRDRLDAAGEHH
jgi:hypothetical protein